jgi:hypothetical protein
VSACKCSCHLQKQSQQSSEVSKLLISLPFKPCLRRRLSLFHRAPCKQRKHESRLLAIAGEREANSRTTQGGASGRSKYGKENDRSAEWRWRGGRTKTSTWRPGTIRQSVKQYYVEKLPKKLTRKQADCTTKNCCQDQTDNTLVFAAVRAAFPTVHRRIPKTVPRDLRMRSASRWRAWYE